MPTSDPAVEIAYSRPVTVPVSATRATASRLAYGATIPSSSTGTATSTSTAASDPRKPPIDSAPSALTASCRNGSDTNGTIASSTAGAQHDRAQPAQVRAPVGQLPTHRVAGRQRDQDGGDRVGPDDRRGPEVGGEQAGRGDLRAEAGRADAERDRPQPPERDRGGRRGPSVCLIGRHPGADLLGDAHVRRSVVRADRGGRRSASIRPGFRFRLLQSIRREGVASPLDRSHVRSLRRPTADLRPEPARRRLRVAVPRRPTRARALVADPEGATASVVLNSFTEIGLERLVGAQARVGERLARVRAERPGRARCRPAVVGLEILEDELLDERFVARADRAQAAGYRLALDDFEYTRERRAAADARRRGQARPARARPRRHGPRRRAAASPTA